MKNRLALLLIIMVLAACNNNSNTPMEDSTENLTEIKGEEEAIIQDEEEAKTTAATSTTPASCEGILFEIGKVIEGEKLAACMGDAMIEAGSGSHKAITSTGTSKVDFMWNPDFSMYVEADGSSVIIEGDTGWAKLPDKGWIEEKDDPSDTDEVIASNIVKLTRVFAHPKTIAELFAQTPSWHVVEQGTVPDSDAFVSTAWHLAPEGPMDLGDAVLTDVQLWLTSNYLGAYYKATATMSGITDTTSNTFLQWGEPVEIPRPN